MDINEAIRNRGDAAWTTGGGGGGPHEARVAAAATVVMRMMGLLPDTGLSCFLRPRRPVTPWAGYSRAQLAPG